MALTILAFHFQESTCMLHNRYLKGRKAIWSNMEGKGSACKKEAYVRHSKAWVDGWSTGNMH